MCATAIALAGMTAGTQGARATNEPPLAPETTEDARPAAKVERAGGFIYRDGRYVRLDTVDGLITAHITINDRGETAGSYAPSLDTPALRGFVRSRRGDYTRVDGDPGASTLLFDINDRGAIVGLSGDLAGDTHAFLREPNGDLTAIEVPGAQLITPYGLNNHGAVVGSYTDGSGAAHAFHMERGTVTVIDPPDSPTGSVQVLATDINDHDQIVGCYTDASGTYHGFRYTRGQFTRIDPPGSADVPEFATTCPFGINNRGQVVGQYVDAASILHGYVWHESRGFETIDLPPGAEAVGPTGVQGTIAADINDRGDIVVPVPGGFYKGRAVPVGG